MACIRILHYGEISSVKIKFFVLVGLTVFFFNISSLAIAGESIPAQFRGKWGNKNCSNSGDVQIDEKGVPTIQVDRKSVRVMDMHCELQKATKSDATVFVGKFSCESEGESSNALFTLIFNNGRLDYGISGASDGFRSGSGKLLQRCK